MQAGSGQNVSKCVYVCVADVKALGTWASWLGRPVSLVTLVALEWGLMVFLLLFGENNNFKSFELVSDSL